MTGFVQRLGSQLLLDGAPFRIAGGNTYYLGYVPETTLDAGLDLAAAFSMNVIRTWAFLDGAAPPGPGDICYQYWDPATNGLRTNDSETGLVRLDRAIAKAGERGIRLILTLTNNWPDFGGMPRYVEWFGLDKSRKNEFYTDSRCRQAYQNWLRSLITRRNTITGRLYSDEPSILAWELANEPRCEDNGGTGTLLAWAAAMSEFIKQLDANHLVAVGDEGYFNRRFAFGNALYNGSYGVSAEELLGVASIDFGTAHLYPESMAKDEDPVAFGLRWIREHIEAGERAGKPVLIEEYGMLDATRRNAAFASWLQSIEALSGAGGLLWMLGLPKSDGQPYGLDGYVISDPADAAAVRDHARALSAGLAASP